MTIILAGLPERALPLAGWPRWSIPESGPAVSVALDPWDFGVYILGPDGADKTRVDYLDLKIRGGRFLDGDGSITVPASSPIVGLFTGTYVHEEFILTTLRVFYNNSTTPLWTGLMAGASLRSMGDSGTVEIVFEQATAHALRRRLMTKTAQASEGFTAGSANADNIILFLMRDAMGPTPTEPTGYPVACDRTDFGGPTFEVATSHSPAETSSQPALAVQSGNNLLDVIPGLCEQENIALEIVDNEDQTYDIDCTYPYYVDVSDDVIFSAWLGTLSSFEVVSDHKSLVNTLSIEGATAAGSHTWDANTVSVTLHGVYEGHVQKPQATDNTGDIATAADWLLNRFNSGTQTYKAEIVQGEGTMFNVDWGLRSKVRFVEPVFGYDFDQICTEYELSAQDGGPPQLSVTFGVPQLNQDAIVAGYIGTPGPRMAGGIFRNKRQ